MNTRYYEARKRAWTKYNRSLKKKLVAKRYRDTHKEKCSASSMAWQQRNRKRVRELERKRNATPHGKAIRKAIQVKYNAKNRIKRLAKDAVNNAIRAGKLVRGHCIFCKLIAEGHHPDYTKPLKVRWLCQKHHVILHKKLKKNLQK